MTSAPRLSLARRYRSTFCIFPAMIPLIEILPWLLGLIGGMAGLTEYLREKIWHRPRHRWVFIVAVVSVMSGGAIFMWHESRLPLKDTSVPVAAAQFSPLTTYPVTDPSTPTSIPDKFGLIWRQASAGQLLGTPVLTDTLLMVGTLDKNFEARRLSDGQKVWSLKKKEPVFTSVFLQGEIGVIGEGLHTAPSATLTAFKATTGEPLWERSFRSHIETSPAYNEKSDVIYQSAGAEGLWALDLPTGQVKWHAAIGHIDVMPFLTDGKLFVPAKLSEDKDGSAFFEISPKTGRVISQHSIPGNPMGNILVGTDNQMIFTTAIGQVGLNKGTDKGWIHGADNEGNLLWTLELPSMPLPEGQIWSEKGLAFVTLKNGTIMAIDTVQRKVAWSVVIGGEFRSDVLLIEQTSPALVVAVTSDGFVAIRKALDGTPVYSMKLEGGAYSSPVYKDDILYLSAPYSLNAYGPVSALIKSQ